MSGDRDDVGSVADEAAKLLAALSEWAKDAAHDVESHVATGAEECTYCPICRTVHAVRGLSPEVRTQLATAATTFLQAAAGLMANASPDARGGSVEHIDLDGHDDDGDWPEDTDPEEGER
ncbi:MULTISPECIES: hypothetical protein [unclassified Nocardioides]|jgi:hypothetical protein|uniref:hypothetical protein n=1 Tax=Nocardioides sp. URHA0032 TaxID=1380388 RepID=UPI00048BA86F|nr:hypothetical protein [Nocardioides sp. URHA0032]